MEEKQGRGKTRRVHYLLGRGEGGEEMDELPPRMKNKSYNSL